MEQLSTYLLIISFLTLAAAIGLLFYTIRQRDRNTRGLELLASVYSYSNDPVFIINAGGKVIDVNDAFTRWLGRNRNELIGRSIFLYTTYLQQKSVEKAMQKNEVWAGAIVQRPENGEPHNAYLLLYPLFDRSGTAKEYIGIHLDMKKHALTTDDNKFETAIDTFPDGILILQDEYIVYANPAAVTMLGYDAMSDLTRVHFESFVAPQSRTFAEEVYINGLKGESTEKNSDMKFLTRSNRVIDLEVSSARITWNREPAVLLSVRDVAEQKENEREQAQWLWEQELLNTVERQLVSTVDLPKVLNMIVYHGRLLVRADIAAVLTIDPEKETYRWLAMRGNTNQYSTAFLPLSKRALEFYHESEPKVIQDVNDSTVYTRDDFPFFMDEEIVTIIQYPLMRGSIVFGHLVLGFRAKYELPDRLVKLIQSFIERATVAIMNAELYDQLKQQTKNLQQLYETRIQVQEEERRRIAAELHDSLGQLLTSIKLHIEVLQDSDVFANTSEKEQMGEIRSLLDNAITEARNISYDLRPSILDDFGLIPALEVLCEKFSSRSGIAVTFQSHNLEARLRGKLETALYRITQEALTNVQKHADATEVSVQIIRTPKTINLVIEDNGKGFDPARIEANGSIKEDGETISGMGLVSMRERTAHFDGTFTIDSTPGSGTNIIIEIPLSGVTKHAQKDSDSISR